MSGPARLLVTAKALQGDLDRLHERIAKLDVDVAHPAPVQQFSADEMIPLLAKADVAIVGDDVIDRRVLSESRHLRVLIKWGVGMDAIDLDAARELGVPVVNTPHALPPVVAEGAIGYLLCAARGLHRMDRAVREGRWEKPRGISLHGKTLGIVGMGRIGQELAPRARGLGMRILGSDVRPDARFYIADEPPVAPTPLDDLLRHSDVVVLACNLTRENRHLVNARTLSLMKAGAFLVNVSRGPLVDTAALVAALESGHLGGAAIDVFEDEPLPAGHPLARFENVFLGSHNVQNTVECVRATNEAALRLAMEALGRTWP